MDWIDRVDAAVKANVRRKELWKKIAQNMHTPQENEEWWALLEAQSISDDDCAKMCEATKAARDLSDWQARKEEMRIHGEGGLWTEGYAEAMRLLREALKGGG